VFYVKISFRVNVVSNDVLRGEGYSNGCMGQQSARVWLFLGFLMGFASIIAACWILFADYVTASKYHHNIICIIKNYAFIINYSVSLKISIVTYEGLRTSSTEVHLVWVLAGIHVFFEVCTVLFSKEKFEICTTLAWPL